MAINDDLLAFADGLTVDTTAGENSKAIDLQTDLNPGTGPEQWTIRTEVTEALTGTLAQKLQESSDNSTWTDVANGGLTSFAPDAAAGSYKEDHVDLRILTKRYIRIQWSGVTAGKVSSNLIMNLFDQKYQKGRYEVKKP